MKYKIIPDDIVKNMIEFLDEIQFEAASGNKPEDLHRINFINWMISELMNGVEGFDTEEEAAEDLEDDNDILDRKNIIDGYRKDLRKDFPEDMSEKEFKKLLKNFDAFVASWDKEYKKSNHRNSAKKNTLEEFEKELKRDHDLSPSEKFELYYDEYLKKNNKTKSLKQILNQLGIEPNSNNKNK